MKVTAAILLILFPFLASGQITGVYTADNGLAQGFVTAVVQGSDGFIWAATNNGLSRFDGVNFKNFRTKTSDNQSLYSNQVQKLIKDSMGRLWVVSGGRIQMYSPGEHQFYTPLYCLSHPEFSFNKSFTDNAGLFWVLSDAYITAFRITTYKEVPDLTPITNIRMDARIQKPSVFLSLDSVLWVGTDNGLFEYSLSTGKWVNRPEMNSCKITQLWYDHHFKGIWVVTSDGTAWVQQQHWRWFPELNAGNGIKGAGAFYDQKTWLTDKHNVFEWNGQSLTRKVGDLPFEIVSVCADDQGFLWLGSNAKGLFQIDLKPQHINTIWPGDIVTEPVFKDGKGNVLSMKEKGCRNMSTGPQPAGWAKSNDKFKALSVDASGRSWYIDCNNVLTCPEIGFRSVLQGLPPKVSVNKMRCLPDGSILIVKPRSVLIVHPQMGNEIALEADTVSGMNLEHGFEVNCIKTDQQGNIWLGLNDGVLQLTPEWQSGKIGNRFFSSAGVLPMPAVLSLEPDGNAAGALFLGTLNGFYHWNTVNGQYEKVVARDILADEVIYCMQKDLSGNIWLGTNAGLKMYNPVEKSSKSLTIADGLPAHEFNRNTESISPDGEILMGTVKGAVRFYPDVLSKYTRALRLILTDVTINDSVTSIADIRSEVRTKAPGGMTIAFMLLDFGAPAGHKYQYRIAGLQDEWVLTSQPSVTCSNLSPGHYVFEVCGSNGLSGWSEPCRIDIYIERPLWQTLAMILLVAVFAAGLVFIMQRRKRRQQPVIFAGEAAVPEVGKSAEPEPDHVLSIHEKVVALVELHFRESEFNVMDIQEKLRISKVHLHRKMIEETGKTAAYFLKKRRMDEAVKLLIENPEMTIAQIAYASGFSDPNYFSTVFTSSFGKSPKKFRESL